MQGNVRRDAIHSSSAANHLVSAIIIEVPTPQCSMSWLKRSSEVHSNQPITSLRSLLSLQVL